MLLPFIFITFVVCTAEISGFHAFFLCLSRPLEKILLVSLDACVLWKKFCWCRSMLAIIFLFLLLWSPFPCPRFADLKGSYDNHCSCLNNSGCFRSSCCSVCRSWLDLTWSLVEGRRRFSDREMGRKKDAKMKERKDSASRNSSSSRPGLEQTVARDDPPGSTADGHDDDNASVLSLSSSGVSGYVGTLGFLAVEAHTEHRVLVRRDGGPKVPPPPDPIPAIWLVSMGFRLRPWTLRLRF